MSGDRLVYSSVLFFFCALVTLLLSYCISPASSFAFHPRVSRTDDAIIIDCNNEKQFHNIISFSSLIDGSAIV
jgi:hypothetical protein